MKKLLCLILISFLLVSCSNNELTKEEAKKIIEQYYQLPFQTKIAINRIYDGVYGSAEYGQLMNMGLISRSEVSSFLTRRFEISLNEKAREHWLQNGTMQAPEDSYGVIIFKGYLIELKDLSISSNAKENTAEAEIILKISKVSLIQEIFSPLESNEIKGTINFKLFDNGWKIVEDENSKKLIEPIIAPQHFGGWKIYYENTPMR